jgi:chromosome segregation ATPase
MDQETREYLQSEFGRLHERLDQMDARLDKMDHRMDQMDHRMDDLHTEILVTQGSVQKLDERLEQTQGSVTSLDERLQQTQVLVESLRDDVRSVAEGVVTNRERMDRLHQESHQQRREHRDELLSHLRTSHQSLDRRVSRLEDVISSRSHPRL